MHVLFNRSKILKHEKDVSINKPYHFGIHKAAKTLVERLKWRQALPSNLLILGAYNFALTEEIKTALPHFINDETIIHYDIFAFDSEYLPFQKHQFDCILSFFDIQTINDVPGYLKQIAYCLKPNGLFTGVYVGGGAFDTLKHYFFEHEMKEQNKVSLRFHPTIKAEDIAHLLQRAGFDCPLSDHDLLTIEDLSIFDTLKTFQRLKMTNSLNETPPPLSKNFYKNLLENKNPFPFSVDLIYFTALGKIIPNQKLIKQPQKEDGFLSAQ